MPSMLGDSLLIAPVLHASTAKFYLPAGTWTDFWSPTKETVTGPKWVTKSDYPLDSIPVYVKEGSVLLLGPEDVNVPDYNYAEVELEARAYEVKEEVEVDVPVGVGADIAGKVKVGPNGIVDKGKFKITLK